MEPFEYLSVLISIILGLGITQLLTGFGRWLEQRATLRVYGPSIAWAAFLLVVHVQTWWSMFGMRHWPTWNFLQFSVVLLQPSLLFLLAILAFPGPGSLDDMRANFFRQQRWFFGLLMALLVTSMVKDLVRSGSLPDPANLLFHMIFFGMAGLGIAFRRDMHHRALAYTSLTAITIYIVVLFGRLEL